MTSNSPLLVPVSFIGPAETPAGLLPTDFPIDTSCVCRIRPQAYKDGSFLCVIDVHCDHEECHEASTELYFTGSYEEVIDLAARTSLSDPDDQGEYESHLIWDDFGLLDLDDRLGQLHRRYKTPDNPLDDFDRPTLRADLEKTLAGILGRNA